MEYDVAKKASDETMKLQKARRDFAQLQKDEEKYLNEREAKAESLLAGINRKIDSSASLLGSTTEKIGRAIADYKARFTSFVNKLALLLKRSDDIIDSADALKVKAENLLKLIEEKYKDLQKFDEKLGSWDRDLASREERVKKLNKEADEKLEEATQLADWVHNPEQKRYTIKPKK